MFYTTVLTPTQSPTTCIRLSSIVASRITYNIPPFPLFSMSSFLFGLSSIKASFYFPLYHPLILFSLYIDSPHSPNVPTLDTLIDILCHPHFPSTSSMLPISFPILIILKVFSFAHPCLTYFSYLLMHDPPLPSCLQKQYKHKQMTYTHWVSGVNLCIKKIK